MFVLTRAPSLFPWGTFAVNVLGCLGIGIIATLADERELLTPVMRWGLVTGFLGGFTTFSAFGHEVWRLFEDGDVGLALVYALASVVAGVLAMGIGVALTRNLT